MQWKLPKTFSNWIQRAEQAARGKGHIGLAVLLVERSAYSVDPADPLLHQKGHSKSSRQKNSNSKCRVGKKYPDMHGIHRDGSKKRDFFPDTTTMEDPPLDADADDEGLLFFVQSISCR